MANVPKTSSLTKGTKHKFKRGERYFITENSKRVEGGKETPDTLLEKSITYKK